MAGSNRDGNKALFKMLFNLRSETNASSREKWRTPRIGNRGWDLFQSHWFESNSGGW